MPGMMTSENTRSAENSSSAKIASAHPRWRRGGRCSRDLPAARWRTVRRRHCPRPRGRGSRGRARRVRCAARGGLDGVGRHRGLRQVDRERRAPAGLARDRDVAVGLLGKPNAWLRPRPVPLPTSLVVKNGSKIVSSRAGDAAAGVGHGDGDEVAAAGGLGAQRGMASTFRTRIFSRPSLSMASRLLTARLISAVSNCATYRRSRNSWRSAMSTSIPIRRRRADGSVAPRLDLGADIEHLRLQRLPAGERQQLSGQLEARSTVSGSRRCSAGAALPAVRGGAGSRSRSG